MDETNEEVGHKKALAKQFKGVNYDPRNQKFYAQVMKEGRRQSLGVFETAEEAAKAYAEAKPPPVVKAEVPKAPKRSAIQQQHLAPKRKAFNYSPLRPGTDAVSADDVQNLWWFGPEVLRPRQVICQATGQTQAKAVMACDTRLFGARAWSPRELWMMAVWFEHRAMWFAAGAVWTRAFDTDLGAFPINGCDLEEQIDTAANRERQWPVYQPPRTPAEAVEVVYAFRKRVEVLKAFVKRSGVAPGAFEDLLATPLAERGGEALVVTYFDEAKALELAGDLV